jgi:Protein of unknown function (DUF2877)
VVRSVVPAAASWLLSSMLDGSARRRTSLVEVARTRTTVHYDTGRDDVPVLCVCLPSAVRLPNAVVSPALPTGPVALAQGGLLAEHGSWVVRRWWTPPRPRGLAPPTCLSLSGITVPAEIRPDLLLGAGPGLTPAGDDLLAGALVAAHATADPRLATLRSEVRRAMRSRSTTAVSRGLLTHALDGWATPELADFVTAACSGRLGPTAERLLAVGHTSGAALAAGVLHVFAYPPLEGAA